MANFSKIESNNSPLQRKSCSASNCCCPFQEKRNFQLDSGSWEILLCYACGINGTHRFCIIAPCPENWRCEICNIFEDKLVMFKEMLKSATRNINLQRVDTSLQIETRRCNVEKCLCPHREQQTHQDEIGSWEILLCQGCGINGTHRICSFLPCFQYWRCETCNTFEDMVFKFRETLNAANRNMSIRYVDTSLKIESRSCNVEKCLCPHKDRQTHQEEIGSWEILLCDACGINGTHRICSFVKCFKAWYCKACQPNIL
ncbi:G2/M phase-specific E3 ubiquitin-protein ligase-like isoform X2 [Myzus persicae]|nr:G2/M phase-specific E3 ubiquitin-protein ligase-like isoform X2 [Myzus persicae]XP_022181384.1 G2/M phase-specific E3 ubiquitin-protein ligase-like isoform X2 [Myzus persicae]